MMIYGYFQQAVTKPLEYCHMKLSQGNIKHSKTNNTMQNSNYTQGELKADSHELYILKPTGGRIKLGMAYVQAWGLTTHNTPIIDNEGLANAERLALCWNYHNRLVETLRELKAITNTYAGDKLPQEVADHQNNKISKLLNELNTKS